VLMVKMMRVAVRMVRIYEMRLNMMKMVLLIVLKMVMMMKLVVMLLMKMM